MQFYWGGIRIILKDLFYKFANDRSSVFRLLLLTGWTSGLLLGVFTVRYLPVSIHSLLHTAVSSRMSFVGGVLVQIFPLLITVLMRGAPWRLFWIPIAFFEAYCGSYVSGCIFNAFGNGGWLVRWLFCFSSILCNTCLLFFQLNSVDAQCCKRSLSYVLPLMAAIILLDYFSVSPFLMALFDL